MFQDLLNDFESQDGLGAGMGAGITRFLLFAVKLCFLVYSAWHGIQAVSIYSKGSFAGKLAVAQLSAFAVHDISAVRQWVRMAQGLTD